MKVGGRPLELLPLYAAMCGRVGANERCPCEIAQNPFANMAKAILHLLHAPAPQKRGCTAAAAEAAIRPAKVGRLSAVSRTPFAPAR